MLFARLQNINLSLSAFKAIDHQYFMMMKGRISLKHLLNANVQNESD